MDRKLSQPTFFDNAVLEVGAKRTEAFFADVLRLVPWEALAQRCGDVFPGDLKPVRGGRPHWPVVLMLKVQFLQACFNLSDPAAEEAINDRLSFRRFLGLSLIERGPDQSAIQEFRDRMIARGHGGTVFDTIKQTLEQHGLVLKEGTLIDAMLIERGRGQYSRSSDERSPLHTRDKTAGSTRDRGRTVIGHKASVATDVRGTIIDFVYDSAAVHESNHFEQLARDEKKAVYADKAYGSQDRMNDLRSRGVFPGIGIKRVKGQEQLYPWQERHNKRVTRLRCMVEHPFALMRRLGLRRLIYRGLRKNAFRFAWVACVVNLKRNLDPWRASLALAG